MIYQVSVPFGVAVTSFRILKVKGEASKIFRDVRSEKILEYPLLLKSFDGW